MEIIHAETVVTEVIELFLAGNEPMVVHESDDVNCHGLTVKTHATIAPTTSCAGCRSLPDVTGAGLTVNHETKEGNDHVGHDLVFDFLTTAGHQRSC